MEHPELPQIRTGHQLSGGACAMKTTFLIGSFLPGYSKTFRYRQPATEHSNFIDMDTLAQRFYVRGDKIRNKGTGYVLGIQAGLAVALILVVAAFKVPFTPESEFKVTQVQQELVTIEEIQQTTQELMPPPQPRPMIPLAVPDDQIIVEEELELDVALEIDEAITDLAPPLPAVEEEEEEPEPEIFVVVEQMPEIKGGLASLMQAVEYPRVARLNGIQGNVIVKIVVTEEGIPINPEIIRSPSPLLEEAAIAAVMKQRFIPGKQRGRPVKVQMVMPVKFKLTE